MSPEEAAAISNTEYLGHWDTYRDGERFRHFVQAVQLPSRRHQRLLTAAYNASQPGTLHLANLEGWTESIHGDIAHETQAELAELNPDIDISTEATYGMDGSTRAPHRPWKRITYNEMARETFSMLQFSYGNTPLVLSACSMSAGVVARIERLNQAAKSPLNIVGRIMYEPCLTSPENSGLPMALEFGWHMRTDSKRVRRETPRNQRPGLFFDVLHSGPRLGDWPNVLQHGIAILGGTPHEDQRALDRTCPIDIRGSEDCLTSRRLPGLESAVVKEIEGAGHAMGAIAVERAVAITEGLNLIRQKLGNLSVVQA